MFLPFYRNDLMGNSNNHVNEQKLYLLINRYNVHQSEMVA